MLSVEHVYSVAAPARLLPDYRRSCFPGPAATYPAMTAGDSAAAGQVSRSEGFHMPGTSGMPCGLRCLVSEGVVSRCGPWLMRLFTYDRVTAPPQLLQLVRCAHRPSRQQLKTREQWQRNGWRRLQHRLPRLQHVRRSRRQARTATCVSVRCAAVARQPRPTAPTQRSLMAWRSAAGADRTLTVMLSALNRLLFRRKLLCPNGACC